MSIEMNEILEKQKKDFEKNIAIHDANYEALPLIFKKRIDRLRKNNPNFRWAAESYDVFACKEGIKIAETLKTIEKLEQFSKANNEEQIGMVPDFDQGHSGGTYSQAMQIARCLIEKKENYIPFIHCSLAHIAGCDEIGCIPISEQEAKEYGVSLEDVHK